MSNRFLQRATINGLIACRLVLPFRREPLRWWEHAWDFVVHLTA